MNPMTGSGTQQARRPGAEKTGEVVRNHEVGTSSTPGRVLPKGARRSVLGLSWQAKPRASLAGRRVNGSGRAERGPEPERAEDIAQGASVKGKTWKQPHERRPKTCESRRRTGVERRLWRGVEVHEGGRSSGKTLRIPYAQHASEKIERGVAKANERLPQLRQVFGPGSPGG
jgi:hypothetical protein